MACQHTQQLLVRLSLLLAALTVGELPVCHGYHRLNCAKWKTNCQKYELHNCNDTEWTSCCAPQITGSDVHLQSVEYQSKTYTINTGKFSTSRVWCDMTTEGGGWLTILRRVKGARENFNLYREDYMTGFGNLESEFWLGLRTMQILTAVGDWELRVDLYDHPEANVSTYHAKYSSFKVGNYPDYRLELGMFNGSDDSMQDKLREFSGQKFVVLENQLDDNEDNHCAVQRGGWWYKTPECINQGSVLTQRWNRLRWFKSKRFMKYEMKIRPTNCSAV